MEKDDPVDTDIDLETNVVKNTELSTSESVLIHKKKWIFMT